MWKTRNRPQSDRNPGMKGSDMILKPWEKCIRSNHGKKEQTTNNCCLHQQKWNIFLRMKLYYSIYVSNSLHVWYVSASMCIQHAISIYFWTHQYLHSYRCPCRRLHRHYVAAWIVEGCLSDLWGTTRGDPQRWKWRGSMFTCGCVDVSPLCRWSWWLNTLKHPNIGIPGESSEESVKKIERQHGNSAKFRPPRGCHDHRVITLKPPKNGQQNLRSWDRCGIVPERTM